MEKLVNAMVAFIIANVIGDGKSATFGSIVAVVEQKMRGGKSGRFAGYLIEKVGKYAVTFNANYQNAVNNQLKREGQEADFEAQGNWFHKGFDPYNGSIIIKNDGVNKGKLYLSCIVNGYEKYGYLINGRPATARETAEIDLWKQASYAPANQGTEKPIIFRTFMLENIREIHANGLTYTA
jgi:hypothetical protein